MGSSMIIVETKLIPPLARDNFIRRPSLFKKMKGMRSCPATLIHSGAGYGKSTALSLFLHDVGAPFCWYTITAGDDDILPFITYLIHAIRRSYPQFGTDLLNSLQSMEKYFREEELDSLTGALINELSFLKDNLTIVLDDFHLVDHSFSINQWMENVIDLLPRGIHFAISSRMKPKWKLLSKWKLTKKLHEIDQRDFVVNQEEIDLLLNEYYDAALKEEEIARIYEFTEGWIIALSMIGEQLESETGKAVVLEEIIQGQHTSMDELFHYLAEEVFSKQTSMVQHFLKQTSILEEISPEICDEIIGLPASDLMLEQLSERNTFIHKAAGHQYRFHALFKSFLEKKLKEESKQIYEELHKKSAAFYLSKNNWDSAIYHYDRIQFHIGIAKILEKWGKSMLQAGKLEGLSDQLKRLPAEIKNEHVILWLHEGDVLRHRSYYEKAERCYQHLLDICRDKNEYFLCSQAYMGIAAIYLDTIQPLKAERYLFDALTMLEKLPSPSMSEKQKIYKLITENLVNSGNAVKAEKWYEKLESEKLLIEEGNLDARMYLRTGKLSQAKSLLMQRKSEEKIHLPQSHRETDLLFSLIEAFIGNGEEAKRLAQKGIEQGIRYKTPFVEACGWIRMGHAVQQLDRYHPDLAEECYMTALKMMGEMNVSRGNAEPYMGLCILYGRQGAPEKALEAGRRALYETEKVQDMWLSSLIKLCMGISYVYSGKLEDAMKEISEAKKGSLICGDQYGLMAEEYWLARIALDMGDDGAFGQFMSKFLQDVQFGEYEFFLKNHTTFGPKDLQAHIPLLLKAKELEIDSVYTRKLLKEAGYDEIESHPGYSLTVATLGEFHVRMGDRLIEDKDWQREKAKELFQFFIIHKGEWWNKEELCEELWPENSSKSNDRDFKVALNALNNALEPNRKPREKPFFVQRVNNGYGLNPKAMIEIDCILMQRWIQEGLDEHSPEKSGALLKKGISLYNGEFLAEKKGCSWCEGEKEKWKLIFLRGAERLAQIAVQTEQYDEAISWCEKILEQDSSWEEAYRLLMFCYYQKNNRPQALKWFNKCVKKLNEELGVEPMERTRQMYGMILEAN
ncbi:BTAD domain-containing putative transcriptional regulator [Falsibacillus pallidus]|uniref:BTAD domain-containing putative transcriptional regulator n=1 Tax=Falsibacillus pallidus TaxID=493781 RepID=UPI003D98A6AA